MIDAGFRALIVCGAFAITLGAIGLAWGVLTPPCEPPHIPPCPGNATGCSEAGIGCTPNPVRADDIWGSVPLFAVGAACLLFAVLVRRHRRFRERFK